VKTGARWEQVLAPSEDDMGEDLLRELASLHRVDAALVVSSFERDFLTQRLGFPDERLLCLPFPTDAESQIPSFTERSGFCFLGNFRHPPNLDSVRWLLSELWPVVRRQLPEAELHLYGAYPPAEISLHKGQNGIFAHGPVANHRAALGKHKALLAPLRFGAGIKGKVLEAWGAGTPVVGSVLTFEGMGHEGLVTTDALEFAHACAALDGSESIWTGQSEAGLEAVRTLYNRATLAKSFLTFLERGMRGLESSRSQNLLGRILRHQQSNSTKYFSRWIEAKNAGQPDA
jgi:glycosyltransferase involved in cell wall biosynthesis